MEMIIGIKCKDKFFVTDYGRNYGNRCNSLENLVVNGKRPQKTFHSGWCVVDKEPGTLQKYVKQPDINYRYELIDKTMESDRIPLVLNRDDATEYDASEGVRRWKGEHKTHGSLYELHSDEQPDILKDVEFEYETIMEVVEIKEPKKKFRYAVKGIEDDTATLGDEKIKHQLLDEIIFPDILLPSKPCALSPEESFKIVRQYVKQNINFTFALITADYDFCFTVKKNILLNEVDTYKVNVNDSWFTKRKRKPRYEMRYIKGREVECFEMAPKPYQNYSVIEGFRGKDQDDLQDNIDDYCKNLIKFINEPVVDCPTCKGRGVILNQGDKQ